METVGNKLCFGYTNLTKVTIPSTVTLINEYAFKGCSALTSVYCKAATPPTVGGGGQPFNDNASGRKIYIPASDDDNVINAYKAAAGWSEYAADIEEYEFTE